MNIHPQILVIGSDPTLAEELAAVVSALKAYRPVVRYVREFRQAPEMARSWRPDLALVDMSADLGPLKVLAGEMQANSPETALVGVFRPDIFSHDVQESVLLIEAIRIGLGDFIRRPISSADLEGLLSRRLTKSREAPAKLGKLVAFISNKGGVGKSTLAVNAACGLALRHPDQVLLLDASLQIGSCATLLDLHPETTLTDAARQRDRLDETLIRQLAVPHPSGLHLLAAPANAIEGTEVTDEVISRVLTLARRSYEYVIVDSFPVFDSVMMAVLDLCDLAYVVLENVVPTLLTAARLMELLAGLGFPADRQRIVLNRHQRIAGNPRPAEVAQRLGRDVDHIVPYDRKVVMAANTGEPFVLRAGRFSSSGRALRGLVNEIEMLGHTPTPFRPRGETPGNHTSNGNGAATHQPQLREAGHE